MAAPVLMTQAEYARHRGVTPPSVTGWKKAGLLVFAEDPAGGRLKVDAARTDARINARVDPTRGRPPAASATVAAALQFDDAPAAPVAPTGENGLQAERLLEMRERRLGQALKNEQAAKTLLPVAELESRASAIGRAARERMQAMARSLAERLAAERDIRAVMALLESEIDRVFEELANEAEGGAFAEQDDPALDAEEEAAMAAALADADEVPA